MRKVLFFICIFFIFLLIFLAFDSYIQVSCYPILKNIEEKRIIKNVQDYYEIETTHFTIKHKYKDKNNAKITGEILEKYYNKVCNKLKYLPEDKIPVIIYNDGKSFIDNIKLDTDSVPLGAYYSGTINILSPNVWIKDKQNLEKMYRQNSPAVHEFTHFIVDEKTKGNYPMWLTEGISLYMENITTGFEWELGKGKTKKITMKDLNNKFDKIDKRVAYRKSYEVVKQIINTYGFDRFNLFLDSLGKGKDINTSLKVAFKLKLDEIK